MADRIPARTSPTWKALQERLAAVDAGLARDLDSPERKAALHLARVDSVVFCHVVMRDEKTRRPVQLQPVHVNLVCRLTRNFAPAGVPWPKPEKLLKKRRGIVVTGSTGSGKTQLAIACALFLQARAAIDRGTMDRVAYGADTDTVATDMALQHATYVSGEADSARAFQAVFPELTPGSKWGEQSGYRVAIEGEEPHTKDAAIRSFGTRTNVLSRRVDQMVLDDFVTQLNTATPHLRQKTLGIIDGTLDGRVEDDGEIWALCNAWVEDDATGVLAGREDWESVDLPVATGSTEAWEAYAGAQRDPWPEGPPPGESCWPARWPVDTIIRRVRNNPYWKQNLFCVRRKKVEGNRFAGVIQRALDLGQRLGLELQSRIGALPEGAHVAVGIDLAFSNAKDADKNAFCPVMGRPDGIRYPLWLETDAPDRRWTTTEFRSQVDDYNGRYRWPTFVVESVAGQKWIADELGLQVNVEPCFTTSEKKLDQDLGIEAIALDMGQGHIALPCSEDGTVHPHVARLIEAMESYDPRPGVHTPDELIAFWEACRSLKMSAWGRRFMPSSAEDTAAEQAQARRDGAAQAPLGALEASGFRGHVDSEGYVERHVGADTPGDAWEALERVLSSF